MRTLVIGGTGMVGTEVVTRLLARGDETFILSPKTTARHPAGARLVRGDLDDPASVLAAAQGMDRVFLLVAQGPREAAQGLAAVEAARITGVRRLVYMSVRMPPFAAEVPHFASKQLIETAVLRSGIPATILRPNNFFQNDLAFLEAILHFGVYPQPIGAKGVARVDIRDIADAAMAAFADPALVGNIVELNGPDLLTGQAVAEAYARRLGRPVKYAGDSLDAWAGSVAPYLPGWLIGDLRVMYQKFQEQGLPSTPEDDRRFTALLGRPPRTFDAFVREVTAPAADPVPATA